MYFQDLLYWVSAYIELNPGRMRDEGFELLFDAFSEMFPHEYPTEWFDNELKALTGIDVFGYDFSHEQGFTRIQRALLTWLFVPIGLPVCMACSVSGALGVARRGESRKS